MDDCACKLGWAGDLLATALDGCCVLGAFSMVSSHAQALEAHSRIWLHAQAEMNTSLADQLAFAEEARRVAEQLASARQTELTALKRRLKAAEKAQATAEQRMQEGELVRRQLHNTILVRLYRIPMPSE